MKLTDALAAALTFLATATHVSAMPAKASVSPAPLQAQTELRSAIESNNADDVETALLTSDPNERYVGRGGGDRFAESPLWKAVMICDDQIIRSLIAAKADVHFSNGDGGLVKLAMYFCPPAVPLLLREGASANGAASDARPPLYEAVKANDLDMVRLLTSEIHENPADPNWILDKRNSDAMSDAKEPLEVLSMAVKKRNLEMVKVLLRAGANPSIIDPYDREPALWHTARSGADGPIMEALIHFGADINYIDNAHLRLVESAILGRRSTSLKVLLKHGADISGTVADNVSALQFIDIETQDLTLLQLADVWDPKMAAIVREAIFEREAEAAMDSLSMQ